MMHDQFIQGVNLGGWLVLERWITPSLFADSEAVDEYGFCQALSREQDTRLTTHRQTFITEADFAWMAAHGLNAVRIPVGYWLFGDTAPFRGAIECLDKAFEWARTYKLSVLISLHGALGSQNGEQHSGRAGTVGWHRDETNIQQSLKIIRRLTSRYSTSFNLWGIELLNEPSPHLPVAKLRAYYQAAYDDIRHIAGDTVAVVFSDSFRPRQHRHTLPHHTAKKVYIDTHHYQAMTRRDKRRSARGHLLKARWYLPCTLWRLRSHHSVIVGEWSLALDAQVFRGRFATQSDEIYRSYGQLQLRAYRHTAGWFYWTYKTEDDGPWNMRASMARGWLPDRFR